MADYSSDPHQNPYWRNINGQNPSDNQGWDNRQNTRNTDPHWHPEENLGRQLGRTAFTFGVLSLVLNLMFPIFVPAIFAGIAIVLAIISKGRGSSLTKNARNAVIMGTISLMIGAVLLIYSVFQLFRIMNDPEMLNELNETMEETYGYSLEDMFDAYGISIDDVSEGYL